METEKILRKNMFPFSCHLFISGLAAAAGPTSNPVSRSVHARCAHAHAAARVRTAPQSAVRRLFGNQLSAAPFPAPPPASCQ